MSVHQQHLLQVLELWDGVVAVPGRLPTLLTHDALGGKPGQGREAEEEGEEAEGERLPLASIRAVDIFSPF